MTMISIIDVFYWASALGWPTEVLLSRQHREIERGPLIVRVRFNRKVPASSKRP